MPIWLRNFTLRQISDHYEREHAAISGKGSKEQSWVDNSTKNKARQSDPESAKVKVPGFLNKNTSSKTTKSSPKRKTSYK